MSKLTQTAGRPRQCGVCSKSFKTQEAIVSHSLATGHQVNQCCPALTSPKRRSATGSNSGTASSSHIEALSCRGNTYSRLSTADQSTIYDVLVSSCHPLGCLKRQRYALGADPQRESGAANESKWTQSQYLLTPKSDTSLPKRKAVVLDCEMAGVEGGQSEVVLICVVDFLTGEVLVNSFVKPRRPIVAWRSNISGVTPAIMSIAVARKQALDGWEAARVELWRHVDQGTVLVGQSLNFDLQALRVVHRKIVDSAILTAEAVFGRDKEIRLMWGLRASCEDLLGLRIRNGSGIHDGLEDAIAARELVLWYLRHPVELKTWAAKTRSFWRSKAGGRVWSKKPKRKVVRKARWEDGGGSESDGDQSADEVLRWEDVVDYDMWPKSPPDSDRGTFLASYQRLAL